MLPSWEEVLIIRPGGSICHLSVHESIYLDCRHGNMFTTGELSISPYFLPRNLCVAINSSIISTNPFFISLIKTRLCSSSNHVKIHACCWLMLLKSFDRWRFTALFGTPKLSNVNFSIYLYWGNIIHFYSLSHLKCTFISFSLILWKIGHFFMDKLKKLLQEIKVDFYLNRLNLYK